MAANQRQQTKESDLQHRQGVGFEMMVSKQAKKERKKERKADQNNGKETGKGRWLIQKECGGGGKAKAHPESRVAQETSKRGTKEKKKKRLCRSTLLPSLLLPQQLCPPPPLLAFPFPKKHGHHHHHQSMCSHLCLLCCAVLGAGSLDVCAFSGKPKPQQSFDETKKKGNKGKLAFLSLQGKKEENQKRKKKGKRQQKRKKKKKLFVWRQVFFFFGRSQRRFSACKHAPNASSRLQHHKLLSGLLCAL